MGLGAAAAVGATVARVAPTPEPQAPNFSALIRTDIEPLLHEAYMRPFPDAHIIFGDRISSRNYVAYRKGWRIEAGVMEANTAL